MRAPTSSQGADHLQLHAISDGTFVARPSYFGEHIPADARSDVFDREGTAWLPIGCFLIRTLDRVVLVDAGLGPQRQQLPDGMELIGGHLLTGLTAAGTALHEITDVVCTHLHSDHVGWLFDRDSQSIFPEALIWFGAADWGHFIDGPGEMDAHIRAGFRRQEYSPRLRPLDQDAKVASGVTAIATPGHTPGHLCVMVDFGERRSLLLGDAITHPVQLDEPGWHSIGDVDVDLANRTRERLWRDLEDPRTTGAGAHFPSLRLGRVHTVAVRSWAT